MDASGAQPQVIIFTRLPGTGKSTLAEQVARTVGAPAFAGDWLMGALKPAHAALGMLERSEYVAAWFGLLRNSGDQATDARSECHRYDVDRPLARA